jgi:hypothetical protein
MVFKAIGQTLVQTRSRRRPDAREGPDRGRRGPQDQPGRCLGRRRLRSGGEDLTVAAVEDGKIAAEASTPR